MIRLAAIILLLLGIGAAEAQRGVGTRAVIDLVPAPVPTITLEWTPNPNAVQTVIVSSTNLLTPPPWLFRAAVINDITNRVSFPRTNAMEFFRAYS